MCWSPGSWSSSLPWNGGFMPSQDPSDAAPLTNEHRQQNDHQPALFLTQQAPINGIDHPSQCPGRTQDGRQSDVDGQPGHLLTSDGERNQAGHRPETKQREHRALSISPGRENSWFANSGPNSSHSVVRCAVICRCIALPGFFSALAPIHASLRPRLRMFGLATTSWPDNIFRPVAVPSCVVSSSFAGGFPRSELEKKMTNRQQCAKRRQVFVDRYLHHRIIIPRLIATLHALLFQPVAQ